MNSKFLERRTYFAGRTIFREGESGAIAFILQSGRVRILKDQADGTKGTLGFIEAGGIFGEMALIDNSPRMATAIAEEASTCMIIPEVLLKKKLSKTDPIVRMMIKVLLRLVRSAAKSTILEPVDLEELTDRLASESIKFEPIIKED